MPAPITALDLITDAFLEAGIAAAGETLSAHDSAFGLSKLSRLLDAWDAERLNVFALDFLEFTLIPGVQPLTIGQAFKITQASLTSNVATYIAANGLKTGDVADISGCTTAALNVSAFQVIAATPTQFQLAIASANIAPENETGALAVYTTVPPPNFPTFTQRPARIENASIVLNNVSPVVKVLLRLRDADWWAANSVPNILSTLPTDLYYSPQWPNGKLYLWPEQNTNYGLELNVWINLADIPSLTYSFYLPQGYRDAVTYTLAETLCPAYGRPLDQTLAFAGMRSRAVIRSLNSRSPMMVTRDPGIPRGSHNRSFFNWLNGSTVAPRS
ncbi:MAG: hypothetical protein ACRD2O_00075 [Terriglobia bacterium]